MNIFQRWPRAISRRRTPQRIARDAQHKSISPKVAKVQPKQAVTTPRRYQALAREGYCDNVVAYRAMNMLAQAVSALPLKLYQGQRQLLQHPVLELLQTQAARNISMQQGGLLSQVVHHYLIAGNAYLLAVGPEAGPPTELWPLRPDCVRVLEGASGVVAAYDYRQQGKWIRYQAAEILHWRSFNPLDTQYGMAPLEAAALSIDQHNDSGRWNLALVQNGGVPSGVLYQEGEAEPLTDQQFSHLKSQIEERHTGPAHAGRPLLLEGGLRWQEMGRSARDLDWQAGMNMAARDIAMAFGVPPQMLGLPDSQTYSNYAEARQSLYEETVLPMAQSLITLLNGWLLPRFGRGLELSIAKDEIPALEAKRMAKYSALSAADFLSVAEKRRMIGLPPISDSGAEGADDVR